MTMFDFNEADPQEPGKGSIIPSGTICLAVMTVRPGGVGEGGVLKKNKAGDKEMLDVEFTIAAGPYERRKFWTLFTVKAEDTDSGAPNISRSQLRAALESAYCISPTDESAAAMAKRQVKGWMAFDGLTVCLKVGIEKSAGYDAKNKLTAFISCDEEHYIKPTQANGFKTEGAARKAGEGITQTTAAAPSTSKKPAWAS